MVSRHTEISILQTDFMNIEDRFLVDLDLMESDPNGCRSYADSGFLGNNFNEIMLGMESVARQLIYKDSGAGVDAFADYLDAVLLLSERLQPLFPDQLGYVVDRHLGGCYAMGRLPVKNYSELEM